MRLNLSAGHAAGAAVALCVVCFTFGSSSVPSLKSFGEQARWASLIVLFVVSVGLLLRRPPSFPVGLTATVVLLGGTLVGLLFLSAAWSSDPRLTFHRAVSFAILLAGVGALAAATAADPQLSRAVATGILAGVSTVIAGGLLLLASGSDYAAQASSFASPWRFQGLGENPNTVAMLAAITMPLGVWAFLESKSQALRVLGAASLVLAYTGITLSASRGAQGAAVVGTLVMACCSGSERRALRLAAIVVILGVSSLGLSKVPSAKIGIPPVVASGPITRTTVVTTPARTVTVTTPTGVRVVTTPERTVTVTTTVPGTTTTAIPPPPRPPFATDYPYGLLSDEVGVPSQEGRSLLGSSGRVQAWRGAIGQGNERPLLGYGFGTESLVFFDRYQTFESQLVENSFVGLYLQLGLIGLLAFVAFAAAIAAAGVKAVARGGASRPMRAALLGVLAGGVALMAAQSFAYSPGNLATVSFWVCAGLIAGEGWIGATEGRRAGLFLPTTRSVGLAALILSVVLVALVPVGRWQKNRAIARTGDAMEALLSVPGPDFGSHLSGARIARGFDCLLYSVDRSPTALEFCFSADGHLAEAIDRRRTGLPHFLSLRDEPEASPVHPSVATLLAGFHRAGLLREVPVTATSLPISGTNYAPTMIKAKQP